MTEPQATPDPNLMGYPDLAALANAKRSSDAEAKRMNSRLQELEQIVQQQAQAQNQPRNYGDPLEEFGLPSQALRAAWKQDMQNEIRGAFEPLMKSISARTEIVGQYADYNKYEADVAQWIASDEKRNRTYNTMFNADPAGAMDWAFLKFGHEKRGQATPPPSEEQAREAAAAAIPGARQGDSRNGEMGKEELLQRAFEHYQKTGNPQAYAMARLGLSIPDSHFADPYR